MRRRPTLDEWSSIGNLFDELFELTPDARLHILNTRSIDPFIRDEVIAMLDVAGSPGVLDSRRSDSGDALEAAEYSSLPPGSEVGAFKIERLIGRGGGGEVYLAHRRQTDFEQRVALKLLRPEAVGRMAMFDEERRLLSTLEHPGIARLIDGGLAPDGRPYMAMEYVEGLDIVDWCRDRKADLDTRLRLVEQVCEAVAYAHRRLIVHRDIKPANILVDGEGRVRLLDFGVARLMEGSDATTGTVAVLTPEYAAPEQLENRAPTTSADVYGLGAVLFELLTGRGPWNFDDAPMPTVLRRLLHDDPPVPSKAADEQLDPPLPPARLKGDLDAVVLKAMRRNPADRYDGVAALADDLSRHRRFLPVRAREGKGLYLAQRFVRRHRWGASAAAAALLAVLVGAGGIAWQARATAVERDIARAEAARAEAVNRSVMLMFRNAAASGRGDSITAHEMLNASTERLLAVIDPNDAGQSETVVALADLYFFLDDVEGAQSLLTQALEKGVGRNDPFTTGRMRQQLASIHIARAEFDQAAPLMQQAGAVWAGDPERYRVQRLEAIALQAYEARLKGDRETGIRLLMDSMPEAELAYADDSRELITRYANLAIHLVESNRLEEAEDIISRGEAVAERARIQDPAAITLIQHRGAIASRRGDLLEAERYMRQAVDMRRELYGSSMALAIDLLTLGRLTNGLGRSAEALTMLDEARTISVRNLGEASVPTYMIDMSRADALTGLNRNGDAQAVLDRQKPTLNALGSDSLTAGVFQRVQAAVYMRQGRLAEATVALDHAERIFNAHGEPGQGFLGDVAILRRRIAGEPWPDPVG